MSNRILGFIILIIIFGIGYGFYLVFFVKYTGTLEITSNLEKYTVSLYAEKMYTTNDYECNKKICTIKEISPFNYKVTLSSPTYKDVETTISLKGKKINKINATFTKDTKLTEVKEIPEIREGTLSTKELAEKKIEEIRLKKESNYIANLGNLGIFYFKASGKNLDLYRTFDGKEKKLGTFNYAPFEEINIMKIENKNDKIFFSLKDNKYIYNLELSKVDEIKLVPNVKYVKEGDFITNYQIITDVGTYTYNELSKELKYFYLFKDYVYVKNTYIGVIYKDEIKKFKNFGIENTKKNIIINYNPSTLKREVILETEMEIVKIIKNNEGKIYFYDNKGKKYELENY
ncbi:hypothetical protein EOM39_02950 [Candidatus Gracilibacteria bacterium]|nr:hypothetical protein [Candidatus Gracilibacteria bacterium]